MKRGLVLFYGMIVTSIVPSEVLCKPPTTPTEGWKAAAHLEKTKEPAAGRGGIVGEIGEYVITGDGLEQRLIEEMRNNAEYYAGGIRPDDVNAVLTRMIAEKAMIIEGRTKDYLEKHARKIHLFKARTLASLLLRKVFPDTENAGQLETDVETIVVPNGYTAGTEPESKKQEPKEVTEQLFARLSEDLRVEKLRDNFPRAAEIHQRLLLQPEKERRGWWIMNRQVRDELAEQEKALPLAVFDGGQVTLLDWFETLCDKAPPRRPKDLSTVEGVERLLDKALRMPVFVAEAKRRGLENDPNYLKQLREREDKILLAEVRAEACEQLAKVTPEEASQYFERHKEQFKDPDTLKINQIWCEDLATAEMVKEVLDRGGDFESVKQDYSFLAGDNAVTISAEKEGIFFAPLWEGEPNQIVGPVKGPGHDGDRWLIAWRVVKILQKKPGLMREPSKAAEREVQKRIGAERKEAALADYGRQLLREYPYKIYSEQISSIDPLDIH
ncbi:MAG: hypothetical protein ACYTBJ_04465 [Planctomycetota bacterium]